MDGRGRWLFVGVLECWNSKGRDAKHARAVPLRDLSTPEFDQSQHEPKTNCGEKQTNLADVHTGRERSVVFRRREVSNCKFDHGHSLLPVLPHQYRCSRAHVCNNCWLRVGRMHLSACLAHPCCCLIVVFSFAVCHIISSSSPVGI